jgi:hypothetical protein
MNPTNTNKKPAKRQGPSLLDEVLERRMLLYALAAGAALAGASGAAQAKVVFTPSKAVLVLDGKPLEIDLNNDGVTDFILRDYYFYHFCSAYSTSCGPRQGGARRRARRPLGRGYYYYFLSVQGARKPNLVLTPGYGRAAALTDGEKIGGEKHFVRDGIMEYYRQFGSSFGSFNNVTSRYLGVRFVIKGEVHYGWIGFRSVKNFTAKLYGWAYETEPNTPIYAGLFGAQNESALRPSAEPTSLELLAAGHVAVADLRRRRGAQSN